MVAFEYVVVDGSGGGGGVVVVVCVCVCVLFGWEWCERKEGRRWQWRSFVKGIRERHRERGRLWGMNGTTVYLWAMWIVLLLVGDYVKGSISHNFPLFFVFFFFFFCILSHFLVSLNLIVGCISPPPKLNKNIF